MLEEPTLKKAVEFAITTEQLGGRYYQRLADKFGEDEEIREVFAQLAKDEEVHERQFTALLGTVPEGSDPPGFAEQSGILKAWSMSQFFTTRDGLTEVLEEIQTREDALQRAFEMEKSTLGYYQALRDALGEEPILNAIIDAEKGHMQAVMRVLVTGAKFRGLGDAP